MTMNSAGKRGELDPNRSRREERAGQGTHAKEIRNAHLLSLLGNHSKEVLLGHLLRLVHALQQSLLGQSRLHSSLKQLNVHRADSRRLLESNAPQLSCCLFALVWCG